MCLSKKVNADALTYSLSFVRLCGSFFFLPLFLYQQI
jgi:hypothetical protein